jgi:hypothetical protein
MVHIADLRTEKAYIERSPTFVGLVEAGGARTFLAVPLLKDGELIGVISIYRQEVRPFSDKQVQLVQNFAAQAVIAIENARLLSELRQRTDDLTESLEQQTATSKVLQVISSSPGELEPVFQTMLENATRICDAKFGTMFRFDGEAFHPMAMVNTPPALTNFLRQRGRFVPEPETVSTGCGHRRKCSTPSTMPRRPFPPPRQGSPERAPISVFRCSRTKSWSASSSSIARRCVPSPKSRSSWSRTSRRRR